MHDGETIDVFAPFGAFSGASRNKNHLIGTVDNNSAGRNNNNGETMSVGSSTKIGGGGDYGVEPQQLDNAELNGGTDRNDNDNNIADNVDGFLDEFFALVGSSGGGETMDDFMDTDGNGNGSGDIAEVGLDWLDDMEPSAFLPPHAAPDAADAGAATTPLPSSAHEIERVPEPAVVEDGAAVAATAVAGGVAAPAEVTVATFETEGSSPHLSGEGSRAADGSATAAVASPPSAGLSAAAAAAAGAAPAPALAGGEGEEGRNGYNDGGAVAQTGGGGIVDAAGVSRKEQLRRQKVARYLARRKNRQWSKAKASSYQSRQRVANSRPRHKGRFLPLESDFVSVAELQRRQRAVMKQMQEKAAAKAAAEAEATTLGTPSFIPFGGTATSTLGAAAVAAASGNGPPLSPEFGNQAAI
eukprot:g16159.t1